MTSADTIRCRLALAREEDGNRETGLYLGDQLQAFDSSEGRFFPVFTFRDPGSAVLDKKRRIDMGEFAFVFVATFCADPFAASEFGSGLFAALF